MLILVSVITIISGTLAYSAAAATSAARSALTETSASRVVVSTRQADEALVQDGMARSALREGFAPAPVKISTAVRSEARRATLDGGGKDVSIVAMGQREPGTNKEPPIASLGLVDGQWPTVGSGAGALQADAAATVGATVGSDLLVDGFIIPIVGLWRESAADVSPSSKEPTLIAETGLVEQLGSVPFLQWSVTPDVDKVDAEHLNALAEGADRARILVRQADLAGRGVTVEGDLAPIAAAAAQESSTTRALQMVSFLILLLASAICAAQVLRLVAAGRMQREHLLVARGVSTWRLALTTLWRAGWSPSTGQRWAPCWCFRSSGSRPATGARSVRVCGGPCSRWH